MNVAIIGAGYAGMAAAVTLCDQGIPVTVYEAAHISGGRARRVEIHATALDNGLHILVGAYRETLRLIRQVKPHADTALLRMPLDWNIHQRLRLRAPRLPAPLHVAVALLSARGFAWRDRLAAISFIQGMRQQQFQLPRDTALQSLLEEWQQTAALNELLWHPLCIAALNTPPERASAQVFLNVIRDSLLGAADASELILSRVDLSSLFPEPAAQYVSERGGQLCLSNPVAELRPADEAFDVFAKSGVQRHSHVICATGPHRAAALLQAWPELEQTRNTIAGLTYEPIYSIYLQFAAAVRLPHPMLGVSGRLTQWLFDREALCAQPGLIGAVVSARGAHQDMTQDQIAEKVHSELAAIAGPLPELVWQQVIAEKRATFACTPDVQRPSVQTPVRGLLLAGDYTASDYPATLEAAVLSGISAANVIAA